MALAARLILMLSGALIALGGLYDVLTPRLPLNLLAICGVSHRTQALVRELLRALGAALASIGVAVFLLALFSGPALTGGQLALILLLVLPAEGVNAFCMRRVGSPWQIPLAFAGLTLLGVLLASIA
ncbi:hypothetical protein DYQ86_11085 [Acidobacteria bacterium AB60]|nr:hypothetical protein DYQ86_11085 [Acidobacteria bacterium AB60]